MKIFFLKCFFLAKIRGLRTKFRQLTSKDCANEEKSRYINETLNVERKFLNDKLWEMNKLSGPIINKLQVDI